MRRLIDWLKGFFGGRPVSPTDRSNLMSMYFSESNVAGRKKTNRDRA
jgi:hypothetical protein